MIKLDVKPYCHSCNDFEAHVVKIYPGDGQLYETRIKCEHHERCVMLAEHIQKEYGYGMCQRRSFDDNERPR